VTKKNEKDARQRKEDRRKPRGIRWNEEEWGEVKRRAEVVGERASTYVRRKTLAGKK
tara:strand:- start:379 stop:549 length:171 start_codon:yes stop_codon:yes gene_type:complete